ncbi:MarR family transcriptional regulator [Rhodococcus sp. NPDC003318]|uniref:MarR family transcriptional regulator n=1 Tax=Rhodococcus sp. NPDC003318 TaxID=3364503 RepID=UPI0036830ABE
MVHTDNDQTTFDILHSLRVKGLAGDSVLSGLSGVAVEDLPDALGPLVERGYVVRREGRMPGAMLTAAGKAEHLTLLGQDQATAGGSEALETFYDRFLPINSEFKKVCQRWQMRGEETPNDHSDPGYDAEVIDRLTVVDAQLRAPLQELAGELSRFGRYLPRFTAALERVRGGDIAAFARPLYDSYHDIWMELHEDLIVSSGRTRGTADEG